MQLIPDFVRNELKEGEEIIWTGSPDPKSAAIKALPEALLSLLFFFIAVQGFLVAFNPYDGELHIAPDTEVGLQVVVVMVFTLIGIALLLRPFFAYKNAEKTTYCISNQRVLQFLVKKKTKVTSHSRRLLNSHERKNKKNGKSDLIYAKETYTVRRKGSAQTRTRIHAFSAIDDGDGAERALLVLKGTQEPTSASNKYSQDDIDRMRHLR